MDIGKKIKMLRAGKSVTQEKLAQELNVTPQAVSKWENGTALPDITLLPALSVYFGVRIDDFFELSDEAQFDRIDNWDSIGQIREIQGRWADAAGAYEKVLEVYRDDWGATEGVAVEKYKAAILNCRARA